MRNTSFEIGERSALSTLMSLYERKARSMCESAARETKTIESYDGKVDASKLPQAGQVGGGF